MYNALHTILYDVYTCIASLIYFYYLNVVVYHNYLFTYVRTYLLIHYSHRLYFYAHYYYIQEYLKEPLTGSVSMIHTLCHSVEKKKSCIDVLAKYVGCIQYMCMCVMYVYVIKLPNRTVKTWSLC